MRLNMEKKYEKYRADENNSKWENIIKRKEELYNRNNDIRSDFERDYTRIIHSQAYRRMKHKTQVFFSPQNDHICTRIEHVTHVESISYTIANYLGLNTELTNKFPTFYNEMISYVAFLRKTASDYEKLDQEIQNIANQHLES